MFEFSARKNALCCRNRELLTSNTIASLQAAFVFDEAWEGLERIAVFRCGDYAVDVLLDDTNVCNVPWEVLTKEREHQLLFVGVYGRKGTDIVLPTIWALAGEVLEGTTTGIEASEPTPDVLDQVLAQTLEARDEARAARDDAYEAGEIIAAAVVNSPKIGENGNWWVWDFEKADYVDTGVFAAGGTTEIVGEPDYLALEGEPGYIKNKPIGFTLSTVNTGGGVHNGWNTAYESWVLRAGRTYMLKIGDREYPWLQAFDVETAAIKGMIGDEDTSVWESGGGVGFQIYQKTKDRHLLINYDSNRFPDFSYMTTNLCRMVPKMKIGGEWIPSPSVNAAGGVKAEVYLPYDEYWSTRAKTDTDGEYLYTNHNIVEAYNFTLTAEMFSADEFIPHYVVFLGIGDNSDDFPELTYPVTLSLQPAARSGAYILDSADGRKFSFTASIDYDNGTVSAANVEEIDPFIKLETELVKVYTHTGRGTIEHNALNLVPGETYTFESGMYAIPATAVSIDGTVVCVSDGNYEKLENNRMYVTNEVSYLSPGFAQAMGYNSFALYEDKIIPSIPAAAIDGHVPGKIVHITMDADGNLASDTHRDEIMELARNGVAVYADIEDRYLVGLDLSLSIASGTPVFVVHDPAGTHAAVFSFSDNNVLAVEIIPQAFLLLGTPQFESPITPNYKKGVLLSNGEWTPFKEFIADVTEPCYTVYFTRNSGGAVSCNRTFTDVITALDDGITVKAFQVSGNIVSPISGYLIGSTDSALTFYFGGVINSQGNIDIGYSTIALNSDNTVTAGDTANISIPPTTASTAGQVLTITDPATGVTSWQNIPEGLPETTADDAGKILSVCGNKTYTLVEPNILKSSTEGSTKQFRITVDDSGTLSAVEVTT